MPYNTYEAYRSITLADVLAGAPAVLFADPCHVCQGRASIDIDAHGGWVPCMACEMSTQYLAPYGTLAAVGDILAGAGLITGAAVLQRGIR